MADKNPGQVFALLHKRIIIQMIRSFLFYLESCFVKQSQPCIKIKQTELKRSDEYLRFARFSDQTGNR